MYSAYYDYGQQIVDASFRWLGSGWIPKGGRCIVCKRWVKDGMDIVHVMSEVHMVPYYKCSKCVVINLGGSTNAALRLTPNLGSIAQERH